MVIFRMKTCIKCNAGARQGQSYCKPCSNKVGRDNYLKNKDRYYAQAKKRDKQLDDILHTAKSVPCADCKLEYPYYVMDFDHLRDKSFGIREMRRRRMALDKIIKEIAKCEVVCANCHRERTFGRWKRKDEL